MGGRGRGRQNNDNRKNKNTNVSKEDDRTEKEDQPVENGVVNTAVLETGFPASPAFDMPMHNRNGLDPVNNMDDSITKTLLSAPLSLPTPPNISISGREGVPIILSRNSHPPMESAVDYDSEAQKLSERLATAALEDSFDVSEEKKEVTKTEEAAVTTNG